MDHPRLYFTGEDLPGLRALRGGGLHGRIWDRVRASADWCLSQRPRRKGIEVKAPDPIYENLYDRFYAIMHDVAIIEHLSLAHAIGGEERHGAGARRWLVSSARTWEFEAFSPPDASKAYAVSRLLKGLAVGYDAIHGLLSDGERKEVLNALSGIAGNYWEGYFSTPQAADWHEAAHHHIVEWGSFGVAALSMLGDFPDADRWVDATVDKFEDQLLPRGLAGDGAQTEGRTFWASTMQYRIWFMEALRRVTGVDLLGKHGERMRGELALGSVACEKHPGYDLESSSVVLNPPYGQLDYLSPVLLYLAREYRRPVYQQLALWDRTLGGIQRTRYVTPHGEELMFELGGYAYLWLDAGVTCSAEDLLGESLSYHFPSTGEAYMRSSWTPGDVLVGATEDTLVVHAGGSAILSAREDPPAGMQVWEIVDGGKDVVLRMCCDKGSMEAVLRRPERIRVDRNLQGDWQFRCQGEPRLEDGEIEWPGIGRLRVLEGCLSRWDPRGSPREIVVGQGMLRLNDPAPVPMPSGAIRPEGNGRLVVEMCFEVPPGRPSRNKQS